MDFGKLGRVFDRGIGDRENYRQPDADGNGQRRSFRLVGRRGERVSSKQQKAKRAEQRGKARLKPLTIRNTPVGGWLRRFAPDILRGFADMVPAGFILDSIAALIETRSLEQNQRTAFETAMNETRNMAGIDVGRQWLADMGSDSWLAKNVRPMVLLSLTLAFIVFAIVNAVAPQFFAMSGTVAGMFETLLLTVFGAYFAGRTIEKTMK
jgi:hypothetical protein